MPDLEIDPTYVLADRFDQSSGRAYLTGWDALVRLPIMQHELDMRSGLDTAGFISGYPGSPLGGLDSLLRRESGRLRGAKIHFEPGTNEDLAATAVWGTQYLGVGSTSSRYDGVFGMWYGKGPGVERSTDAMRTANYQGVAPTGGVLALAGDDHEARSTLTAQQSETLFVHMMMPILNPSTIQEYLDLGLIGWALSRYSKCWVAMICLNDVADSAASVDVGLDRISIVQPELTAPSGIGLWRPPLELEADIRTQRLPAAQAFARANRLDHVVLASPRPRIGIVSSGKALLDVHEALESLGLSPERAADLGVSLYKVAMPWPLEPEGIREFVDGLDELVVIEPKHPIMEDQIARIVRGLPADRRPRIVGKTDERGAPLVPEVGGTTPDIVAEVLRSRLTAGIESIELRPARSVRSSMSLRQKASSTPLVRAAGFCSGCPHNTSTKVPEGHVNMAGTGCHTMSAMYDMPARATEIVPHMGGEGAMWIGMAPFTDQRHAFQNIGDGTYSHSGLLAIHAAVNAGVNITFKVLLNGFISMTGGQAIPGGLSAQQVSRQALALGAVRVVVVTDDLKKFRKQERFPHGVAIKHRDELIAVQTELSELDGVSILIYDQACAAELRRMRKRGTQPDPDKRVYIHPEVCEGCGDCNIQSNCISVEPLETVLGRKRTIDQSSCNKDFSCLSGYCPSFVTLRGATPRRKTAISPSDAARDLYLPEPETHDCNTPYNVLVTGIGGGGVLTVGSLIGMAAHLEGKSVSVLNESGLAQKNGAVQSHVRVSADRSRTPTPRIAGSAADVVLGADIVVTSSPDVMSRLAPGRTRAVVNVSVKPTVAFSAYPELDFSARPMAAALGQIIGDGLHLIDAHHLALALQGDAIYANLLMLGYAAQCGMLPVGTVAVERAIEINGVGVRANRDAFTWGRLLAHDPAFVVDAAGDGPAALPAEQSVQELVRDRRQRLVDYQNEAYAQRFEQLVEQVRAAEQRVVPDSEVLQRAVAFSLFKLMAYKDEYEVARLYRDPEFMARIREEFEGDFRLKVNLAPQILNRRDPLTGRARKLAIPAPLAMFGFEVLARCKRLRGTPFDLFGRTAHRQQERARVVRYEVTVAELLNGLRESTHGLAVRIAELPEQIRGYDTVKDASADAADTKLDILLSEFRQLVTG